MEETNALLREILIELQTLNGTMAIMQARSQDQMRQAKENVERMKSNLPPELRAMVGGALDGL